MSDVGTVTGCLDANADYAVVESELDKLTIGNIFGLNSKENAPNRPPTDGATVMTEASKSMKRWPWYAHLNPADMMSHYISEKIIHPKEVDQQRYPGGGHWMHDVLKRAAGQEYTFHTDMYSPIYGLNFIYHFVFESEVLEKAYPDIDNSRYPTAEERIPRIELSRQIHTAYDAFGRLQYVY